MTFETVRKLVLELPGVVEGTSYGTPAFRAGKTLFVRQHQDGESLVVRIDHDQRAMRMRAAPETFFITDHYLNYPWMLVRLATIDQDDLRDLLEESVASLQRAPAFPLRPRPGDGQGHQAHVRRWQPRGGQ